MSVRVSLRGMLRLIRIDTLRNVGFLVIRPQFKDRNCIGLSSAMTPFHIIFVQYRPRLHFVPSILVYLIRIYTR